ncbi:hypothetical protein [Ancylobacter terrae]|uniref:hypothetical protein n=1 Tax=Ancylobacter sp. sgz301288 TaxID=3342077 RepID=UPI00385969AA
MAEAAWRETVRRRHPWEVVLQLGLALWVVRIPLLSVLIGGALLAFVPQTADAMVDIALRAAEASLPAGTALAVMVFVFWAMPVHYSARLLLETDARYRATLRLPHAAVPPPAAVSPPADAAPADPAAPVPPPARRCPPCTFIADCFRCQIGCIDAYVPRMLGSAPFLAVAYGAWNAAGYLPTISAERMTAAVRSGLHTIALVMIVSAVLFQFYAGIRHRVANTAWANRLDQRLAKSFGWLFTRLGMAAGRSDRGNSAQGLNATGRLLMLAMGLVVGGVLLANPFVLASDRFFPRAMALPLIFGAWIPALSLLGGWGRRLRVPLVAGLGVVCATIFAVFGDNHTVRRLTEPDGASQTELGTALDLWMRKNGCAAPGTDCPRPVIVAAAGGASRAGFFTASVIGHFLDLERHRPPLEIGRDDSSAYVRGQDDDGRFDPARAKAAKLTGDNVGSRFFAISGVSGGAVGAVLVAAAREQRGGSPDHPPCRMPDDRLWYGQAISNWRDCLELLASGDFLTPTFFGLAFRDQVPFPGLSNDRAALLEQAWERWFDLAIEPPPAAGKDGGNAGSATGTDGLNRSFLSLQSQADGLMERPWVPYLVLNGTSVATGQRIITSTLAPTYSAAICPDGKAPARDRNCVLFTHAIDFHQLLKDTTTNDSVFARLQTWFLHDGGAPDVARSTAAHNSARFPIISPPGAIRNASGQVIDRIVDGGYFENYGAVSALELAKAMTALQPGLRPFVLVISNDPESTRIDDKANKAQQGTVYSDISDVYWLADANGPLGTVMNVRSGRGRLAVAELTGWLDRQLGQGCGANVAHVQVWPQPSVTGAEAAREVSMSWWLSKPVQLHLHQQLERQGNAASPAGDLSLGNNWQAVADVWSALATPPCPPPPRVPGFAAQASP